MINRAILILTLLFVLGNSSCEFEKHDDDDEFISCQKCVNITKDGEPECQWKIDEDASTALCEEKKGKGLISDLLDKMSSNVIWDPAVCSKIYKSNSCDLLPLTIKLINGMIYSTNVMVDVGRELQRVSGLMRSGLSKDLMKEFRLEICIFSNKLNKLLMDLSQKELVCLQDDMIDRMDFESIKSHKAEESVNWIPFVGHFSEKAIKLVKSLSIENQIKKKKLLLEMLKLLHIETLRYHTLWESCQMLTGLGEDYYKKSINKGRSGVVIDEDVKLFKKFILSSLSVHLSVASKKKIVIRDENVETPELDSIVLLFKLLTYKNDGITFEGGRALEDNQFEKIEKCLQENFASMSGEETKISEVMKFINSAVVCLEDV